MAKYGYIRLDEDDPDVARQASQLDTIGDFDKIFVEQKLSSKKNSQNYEQLNRLLNILVSGDVVIAANLDRICETTGEFLQTADRILSSGADLVCLDVSLDTRNTAGKTSLKMLRKIHEIDRQTMSRKKKMGIIAAREKGKRVGRPPAGIPVGFRNICSDWARGKITGVKAVEMSGMKSTTFYSKARGMGYERKKSGKSDKKRG